MLTSPMLIGLISTLLGTTDLLEIQAHCRRLQQRGWDILGFSGMDESGHNEMALNGLRKDRLEGRGSRRT